MNTNTLYLGNQVTITGPIVNTGISIVNMMLSEVKIHTPTLDYEPTTKQYVDSQIEYLKSNLLPDIDSFSEVVTAFETADSNLEGAITMLASQNQLEIMAEASLARTVENTLQAAIVAEVSAARAAEVALQADIDAEIVRATDAETALQANIVAEVSAARAAEVALQADIVAETSRAQGIEGNLQAEIVILTTRLNALYMYFFQTLTPVLGSGLNTMSSPPPTVFDPITLPPP